MGREAQERARFVLRNDSRYVKDVSDDGYAEAGWLRFTVRCMEHEDVFAKIILIGECKGFFGEWGARLGNRPDDSISMAVYCRTDADLIYLKLLVS